MGLWCLKNCENIRNGYIKYKCLECKEEYIYGLTCKTVVNVQDCII